MQGPVGARTIINGRERDYFAGCSYLGLHSHPAVLRAAQEAVEKYGLSTATSRTHDGYGDSPVYADLDCIAQEYFGTEAVLYFPTGYLGMQILSVGLSERFDQVFIDESTHYCGWDGARLTGKPVSPFRHGDSLSLAESCRRCLRPGERPLVLTDGVFPVTGALAPVPNLLEIVEEHGGVLCLDDAHATGVLGKCGRGTLDHFGIESERCFAAHTLSKAVGAYGGLIAGSQKLLEELGANSHIPLGASTPPLPTAAAAVASLTLLQHAPQRRKRLWDNVSKMRQGVRALGWQVPETPVPIISIIAREGMDMQQMQAELLDRDLCIAYVPKYSDTPESGALRIAVNSDHSSGQIERLLHELSSLL